MSLILRRLTAWLCLALLVLTGVTPAQGLLVCVEGDGCVKIELQTAAGNCGDCCAQELERESGRGCDVTSESTPCPCIDVELPGSRDAQNAPARGAGLELGARFVVPLESAIERTAPAPRIASPRIHVVPRVAHSLAHIRTVVLRR